jgi:hypothetical protein
MIVGEIFVVQADRSSPFFTLTKKQLSFLGLNGTEGQPAQIFFATDLVLANDSIKECL